MKFLFIMVLLFCSGGMAFSAEVPAKEAECPPGAGPAPDSSGLCLDSSGMLLPRMQTTTDTLTPPGIGKPASRKVPQIAVPGPAGRKAQQNRIVVILFRGDGCPHCEKELAYLKALKGPYPGLEIRDFEVWYNKENAGRMASLLHARGMAPSGVPVTLIDDRLFTGFSPQIERRIITAIRECAARPCVDAGEVLGNAERKPGAPLAPVMTGPAAAGEKGESVDIPLLGTLDARQTSLPVFTLVIAGLDSFNPCAFFVLLTLLGLLVHARSRNRMLVTGGVFVLVSGVVYFLFMAAWLNLFLVMGQVALITTIAGCVSLLIAGINIKDFFLFKQGVSLTIPESAKPRLFDRMRKLLHSSSPFSILAGATVLAVVANSYELLCTAGFPMVFTRVLTLHALPLTSYYLYLLFYNVIYVAPLLLIVLAFTVTLGARKLSERQGRVLKLVSGAMMLGLGLVLLIKPAMLNSVFASVIILAAALGASFLVATVARRLGY